MPKIVFPVLSALILSSALCAHADTLVLSTSNGHVVDVDLSSVSDFDANPGSYFEGDYSLTVDGTPYVETIAFTEPSEFGGWDLDIVLYGTALNGEFEFDGPQLYSGPEDSPTFLEGDYSLTQAGGGLTATLDITPSVASTPEPSSIALLGTGLLGVAGTMRRRIFNR